jgi:hypothetical protein
VDTSELAELRERMREQKVTVLRLSSKAQMYPSDMYRIFAGGPVGPVRRARLTEAARELGLYDDTDDTE